MTSNRINLWSSPRNISTALLYAFAQRADTKVVDEPLYAHYLRHQPTSAEHPGRQAIIASMEVEGTRVLKQMLIGDYGKEIVVFKQMTHHLVALDTSGLSAMKNVLLIRDPRAILRSFSAVVDEVTALDIGLPQQYELFQELREAGHLQAVVDARQLLLNPGGVLRQLCEALDLSYTEDMLTWPPGPRLEDGVWAEHWYANVHQSTGFQPYRERTFTLPDHLEAIAKTCRPMYEEMLRVALK